MALQYLSKGHNAQQAPNAIPESVDILLVGAGMSSLYTAWRLLKADPKLKIAILERIDRTGGRLDSDLINIHENIVKEEEGGMRFTFNSMDNLMSLFLYLDILQDIVPFPMSSDGNNRLYFRSQPMTNKEALTDDVDIWSDLYNLEPQESGINPKTIINTVYNRILSVNPEFLKKDEDGNPIDQDEAEKMRKERGPRYWQLFRLTCKWEDVLLCDWSLQALFSNMGYSTEAITLLYRLSGFNGTFLSNMSAGEAYQLLEEFPSDPDFKTLVSGFSTLPNALVRAIGEEKIYLETQVDRIDKNNGQYEVHYSTLRAPDAYQGDQPEGLTAKRGKISAKKIILGLPRLALEKLFIRSGAFQEVKSVDPEDLWNTLQSTSNQPLLKLNFYYDRPWWSTELTGNAAVEFGPNFADLPLGSVYPFYAVDERAAVALEAEKYIKKVESSGGSVSQSIKDQVDEALEKKFKQPAALTIYCDYMNINFWKGLQHAGKPYPAPLQNQKHNERLAPASDLVVAEATKFFKLLFNTHYVPEPILTSARIWSGNFGFYDYHEIHRDPAGAGQLLHEAGQYMVNTKLGEQVGYGVHQWAIGARDNLTIKALIEPIPGIYTCGESFSDYQGWVEGALRSANLVLDRFGIEPLYDTKDFQQRFGSDRSVEDIISEAYRKMYAERIKKDFGMDTDSETSKTPLTKLRQPKHQYGIDLEKSDRLS